MKLILLTVSKVLLGIFNLDTVICNNQYSRKHNDYTNKLYDYYILSNLIASEQVLMHYNLKQVHVRNHLFKKAKVYIFKLNTEIAN